jgi:hypothetical protein
MIIHGTDQVLLLLGFISSSCLVDYLEVTLAAEVLGVVINKGLLEPSVSIA